ncbi:shugoshin 2A [Polymixia lowei]
MIHSKVSTRTATASKIKNKMLNTSSFFKVSLKTNNRALAVALQAQKERSRQLEIETVYLRKEVKALCFDLAIWKHKHKRLLPILKEFHSNTLHQLGMVADFLSESDIPELSDEYNRKNLDGDDGNMQIERYTVQLPQPELSTEMCPPKQTTMDLTKRNTSTNALDGKKKKLRKILNKAKSDNSLLVD